MHKLLERFYRVILIDTGNNMRAENWLAAAEAADLLVVTSTVREDTGYSGLWMLDALQDAGYQNLKHKTVTVLSDPSPQVDTKLAHDLVEVYQQRTRGVYRVPYDPALVAGSVVPYAQLSRPPGCSGSRRARGWPRRSEPARSRRSRSAVAARGGTTAARAGAPAGAGCCVGRRTSSTRPAGERGVTSSASARARRSGLRCGRKLNHQDGAPAWPAG